MPAEITALVAAAKIRRQQGDHAGAAALVASAKTLAAKLREATP